jgi:mono/diheme cytochrome c family protein
LERLKGNLMSQVQQRSLKLALALVAVVVLAVAFYFGFRRTLIADVREALAAPDTTDTVAYGELLFQTRGCVGCHTLEKAGAMGDEGPDLTGLASRASREHIYQSIADPNAIIAAECPEGACQPNVMPNFGQILDTAQIEALTAYLLR